MDRRHRKPVKQKFFTVRTSKLRQKSLLSSSSSQRNQYRGDAADALEASSSSTNAIRRKNKDMAEALNREKLRNGALSAKVDELHRENMELRFAVSELKHQVTTFVVGGSGAIDPGQSPPGLNLSRVDLENEFQRRLVAYLEPLKMSLHKALDHTVCLSDSLTQSMQLATNPGRRLTKSVSEDVFGGAGSTDHSVNSSPLTANRLGGAPRHCLSPAAAASGEASPQKAASASSSSGLSPTFVNTNGPVLGSFNSGGVEGKGARGAVAKVTPMVQGHDIHKPNIRISRLDISNLGRHEVSVRSHPALFSSTSWAGHPHHRRAGSGEVLEVAGEELLQQERRRRDLIEESNRDRRGPSRRNDGRHHLRHRGYEFEEDDVDDDDDRIGEEELEVEVQMSLESSDEDNGDEDIGGREDVDGAGGVGGAGHDSPLRQQQSGSLSRSRPSGQQYVYLVPKLVLKRVSLSEPNAVSLSCSRPRSSLQGRSSLSENSQPRPEDSAAHSISGGSSGDHLDLAIEDPDRDFQVRPEFALNPSEDRTTTSTSTCGEVDLLSPMVALNRVVAGAPGADGFQPALRTYNGRRNPSMASTTTSGPLRPPQPPREVVSGNHVPDQSRISDDNDEARVNYLDLSDVSVPPTPLAVTVDVVDQGRSRRAANKATTFSADETPKSRRESSLPADPDPAAHSMSAEIPTTATSLPPRKKISLDFDPKEGPSWLYDDRGRKRSRPPKAAGKKRSGQPDVEKSPGLEPRRASLRKTKDAPPTSLGGGENSPVVDNDPEDQPIKVGKRRRAAAAAASGGFKEVSLSKKLRQGDPTSSSVYSDFVPQTKDSGAAAGPASAGRGRKSRSRSKGSKSKK